jgi:DNA-binding NtrC family response regulator
MNDRRPRVLVIDDEQRRLDTVCRGLRLYDYHCHGVRDADAALDALTSAAGSGFDLVITDLTTPDGSGLELIERVRARWPGFPIVVITGLASTAEVGTVRRMNIPLLETPFRPDALDEAIRRALGLERRDR